MTSVAEVLDRASSSISLKTRYSNLPSPPEETKVHYESIWRFFNGLSAKECVRLNIRGLSGLGKSAIMLSIANELKNKRSYDIILYCDCEKYKYEEFEYHLNTSALESFNDLFREIATASQCLEILKKDLEEQKVYILSILNNHKCLLLFDKLDDLNEYKAVLDLCKKIGKLTDIIITSEVTIQMEQSIALTQFSENSTPFRQFVIDHINNANYTQNQIDEIIKMSQGIPKNALLITNLYNRGIQLDDIQAELFGEKSELMKYYMSKYMNNLFKNEKMYKFVLLLSAFPSNLTNERILKLINEWFNDNKALNWFETMTHFGLLKNDQGKIYIIRFFRKNLYASLMQDKCVLNEMIGFWAKSLLAELKRAFSNNTWNDCFNSIDEIRYECFVIFEFFKHVDDNTRKLICAISKYVVYYEYSRGFWNELLKMSYVVIPEALKNDDFIITCEVGLTWVLRIKRLLEGEKEAKDYYSLLSTEVLRNNQNREIRESLINTAQMGLTKSHRVDGIIKQLDNSADILKNNSYHEWACRAMLHKGNVCSENSDLKNAEIAFQWVENYSSNFLSQPWANEMVALSKGNIGIIANRKHDWNQAVNNLSENYSGLAQKYDRAVACAELSRAFCMMGKLRKMRLYYNRSKELRDELMIHASVIESSPGWDLIDIKHHYKECFAKSLFKTEV